MISKHHIDTMLIHAGEARPGIEGAVTLPIFQTAMYETTGEADYHDVPRPPSPLARCRRWFS